MIKTSDKSIKDIAADLGIPQPTLYGWNRRYQNNAAKPSKRKLSSAVQEDQKKIKELQKAIKDLEMERDILKKAMGFFMPQTKLSIRLFINTEQSFQSIPFVGF